MVGGASRSVWVDRDRELAVLDSSLAQVRARSPRAVLIMGETGVGKTALVEEFARRAAVRKFTGRCFKFGGNNVPYLPLVEVLRAFAREADPADVVRVLGPARSDLARLLPELAPHSGGEATYAVRGEASNLERARLFERLLGVAERLGRDEPTIVVIEDAHWIDDSTRDTLVFLLHSVRQAQLMLVITCRSEELPPGHPFLTITAELERARILERLDLARLARPDVEKQIAGLVGRPLDARLIDRIVARSGGNPLFVEELVKVGGGADDRAVPVALRDILLGRVASLSAPAQALVRFAAICGPSVEEPVLAAAGLSATALTSALREAADEQVLVPTEKTGRATYDFRHPLLQEVVYDDELPVERARAHAAIAQVLSKEEPTAPDATARLAHHWYAAHEYAHALPAAIQAGIAAYLAYGFAEAFRQFDRAIALWPRVPFADDRVGIDHTALLEYASESATRIGDYARGIELGKQVLASIDAEADPARAATAHSRMRWTLWESGDHAAALADAQEAARLVPADPPSALRANALGHLAALLMFGGEISRALELAREAAEIADAVGPSAVAEQALAVGTIGLCLVRTGETEEGLARIREALTIAERLKHVTGIAVAYAQYAGALDELGRAEETVAVAQQGIAAAQRLGLERTFGALLRGSAAHALYDLGRWDEAEALTSSARPATEMAHEQSAALTGALIAIGRGNLDRARLALMAIKSASPQTSQAGAEQLEHLRLLVEVELLLADGRATEVRYLLEDLATGPPRWPATSHSELLMLAVRAEADIAAAARLVRDGAGAADAGGRARKLVKKIAAQKIAAQKDPLSIAQLAAAEAEEMRSLGNRTRHFLTAAVSAWQQANRPYRLAYAAFRQAEAHIASGDDRAGAAAPLRLAFEISTSLGAAPMAQAIERLARRARVTLTAKAEVSASPSQLTEREREVLTLVASGRTNSEIGEALYISAKTASVHVSNIYAKLGVTRRVEAVQVANQLGLVGEGAPSRSTEELPPGRPTDGLRRLQSLAFVDIVTSTELLARIGDRAWRLLLERFYGALEDQLARFGGREVDRAGDGLLCAFDEPTSAIRWSFAAQRAAAGLDLRVRIGVHTGEVEVAGRQLRGITVHLAARIAAAARPDEVLVSSTVRELTAGAGLTMEDRGLHELKGIDEARRLYAAR